MLKQAWNGVGRLGVIGGCALVLSASAAAIAREDPSVYVARADQLGAAGPGTFAIEDTLFPALAKMDAEPSWMVRDRTRLVKCVPGSADWAEVESWLMATPQRELVEAFKTCTDRSDRKKKWVLGLPYGADTVTSDWVEKGLCVTLTQDNLLATAEFAYMESLDSLADLVTLEMLRLASEKESDAAMDLGIGLVYLGRHVSERPFAAESLYGYRMMSRGLLAMTDAVYTYQDSFRDMDVLVEAAAGLDFQDLKWTQFIFPMGDRLAAEQLMARTIEERRGVISDAYVTTMAALTSKDHPLRRFGAGGHWNETVALQADWFETEGAINRIWGDFGKRWNYSFHTREHARETDLEALSTPPNEMVTWVAKPVVKMFHARRRTMNEIAATRIALGCMAWKAVRYDWMGRDGTAALRPNFLSYVEPDMYNWHTRQETYLPFGYFVPMRDEIVDVRDDPVPHEVVFSVDPADPYGSAIDQAGVMREYGGTQTAEREMGRGPASSGDDDLLVESDDSNPIVEGLTKDLRSYYDASAQKIDVDRYREFLAQGGARSAQEEVVAFVGLMRLLDPSIQPETVNWNDLMDRLLSFVPPGAPPSASIRGALSEVGIDSGTFKQMNVKYFESLMANPGSKGAMSTLLKGGRPSAGELSALSRAVEESLGSPEMISMQEQMIGQMLAGTMGDRIRRMLAKRTSAVNAYSVMLDGSTFVLYSVGPDRFDNRARNVGVKGDDILFWPPVISLYRQAISGN
mgnify:CR=1 FL=1